MAPPLGTSQANQEHELVAKIIRDFQNPIIMEKKRFKTTLEVLF
jgi:hypothetical protein